MSDIDTLETELRVVLARHGIEDRAIINMILSKAEVYGRYCRIKENIRWVRLYERVLVALKLQVIESQTQKAVEQNIKDHKNRIMELDPTYRG